MSETEMENIHHQTVVSNFPEAYDDFCPQTKASCSINSIACSTASMDSFDPSTITEQLKKKKLRRAILAKIVMTYSAWKRDLLFMNPNKKNLISNCLLLMKKTKQNGIWQPMWPKKVG